MDLSQRDVYDTWINMGFIKIYNFHRNSYAKVNILISYLDKISIPSAFTVPFTVNFLDVVLCN
jgi:hypothetical protein